jgi:hypothetical protein
MLEDEGDAFWFKLQSHKMATHQTETKNCQLAKAGPTESTQEGDGDVFSTAIAQILVPYRQLGQCCINLTSNPGMTSVPQKEMNAAIQSRRSKHHRQTKAATGDDTCPFVIGSA